MYKLMKTYNLIISYEIHTQILFAGDTKKTHLKKTYLKKLIIGYSSSMPILPIEPCFVV